MITPSKYKSISATDLKNKTIIALTISEKNKVNVILQRLTTLIKLKHS